MSAWQPIATAPLDGTWVLLTGGTEFSEEPCGPCVVGFWHETSSGWDESWWAYCYFDSSWRASYDNPTHWMPLPEPPQ